MPITPPMREAAALMREILTELKRESSGGQRYAAAIAAVAAALADLDKVMAAETPEPVLKTPSGHYDRQGNASEV